MRPMLGMLFFPGLAPAICLTSKRRILCLYRFQFDLVFASMNGCILAKSVLMLYMLASHYHLRAALLYACAKVACLLKGRTRCLKTSFRMLKTAPASQQFINFMMPNQKGFN